MPIGILIKYDDQRGFGFLRKEDAGRGEPDTFVHVSALEEADLVPVVDAAYEFGIATDERSGRPRAVDLRAI